MPEIKKVYCQSLPAVKLVGRCYHDSEKENGTFSAKWAEWFANDLFTPLQLSGEEPFEDCDAYYGLSRCPAGEPYEYWIGVLMPLEAPVPAGYDSVTLAAGELAVCWVYGKEPDIYFHCCLSRLEQEGLTWAADSDGVRCCMERYVSPRFTEPDDKGNIILDICYYVNKKAAP